MKQGLMALPEEDPKSPGKALFGMTSALWARLSSMMLTCRRSEKTLLPPGLRVGRGGKRATLHFKASRFLGQEQDGGQRLCLKLRNGDVRRRVSGCMSLRALES